MMQATPKLPSRLFSAGFSFARSLPLSIALWGAATLGVVESGAATHLTTVHPSFTLTTLHTGSFQPAVGGMGMLSDGRLVIGAWVGARTTGTYQCCPSGNYGNRLNSGRVFVVTGATAENPVISVDTIATDLEDIMGLTVVNDTIYVSGGNQILRLNRNGNTGPVIRIDTVFILPGTPMSGNDSLRPVKGRSEWMNGLLARNDTFFVNPSSMYNGNNTGQVNPYRGRALAVKPGNGTSNKRGSFRTRATGLRHPAGMSFGPEGTVWTVETQGHWVPTDKLICIRDGAHYGFRHTNTTAPLIPNDTNWNNLPETPAAVFLPQEGSGGSGTKNATGVFANSPGAPLYLTQGPYAGQFIMGDVVWGGIQRFYVEKVNGEYQGAGFVWMGGLSSGAFRMIEGPDGQIYVGMMGTTGDWSWNGIYSGLQKLKYNGTPTFEMLAVRSRAQGMEIEFTTPVDTALALQISSYNIRSYIYTPTSSYGGNKSGTTTLTPSSIQISPDRKRVYLALSGLTARTPSVGGTPGPHRIVELNIRKSYRSATNEAPRDTVAFYTLNAISPSMPFSDTGVVSVDRETARRALSGQLNWSVRGDVMTLAVPFTGKYTIRMTDLRGAVLASASGRGAGLSLRKTMTLP
jgi:hypothetical protein